MMKNILKLFLVAVAITTTILSCKKDEAINYFLGGNNIAFTSDRATTAPFVFVRANNGSSFAKFSWSNPGYEFSTGVSSQDVTYTLEAKLSTASVWVPTKSVSKDLSKTFTQKEINDEVLTASTALNLDPFVAKDVDMRIRASIGSATPTYVYSNVIKYNLTPYSNDPDLWITGDATGSSWTNTPPANQKFTYNRSNATFSIIINFVPGKYYKFLTTNGAWQPQWGGCAPTGGNIEGNPDTRSSDPDAISTPATAGSYKVTVDLNNKKCTVVPQ
jgi:starch-binding outer membrane protein SusE/F